MNVRVAALDTLIKIEQGGAYSTIAVNDLLKQKKLATKDVGLYTELVYGTLGRKRTLDYILEKRVQNPKKLDKFVLPLLRMSVYQLFYLDKIPDRAVLHEAVEIAKNGATRALVSLSTVCCATSSGTDSRIEHVAGRRTDCHRT